MRLSGIVFWGFFAYAIGGAVSGVLLGPDWLRAENSGGIAHWSMLVPALALGGAAAMMRLSVLRRKRDGVAKYVSLLAVALLCCAVAQGNAGWLGRFGDSIALRAFHIAVILLVPLVCSLAIVATGRVAWRSRRVEFRRPAFIAVALWVTCLGLVAFDAIFHPFANFPVWIVASAILCAAALRLAYLIPTTERQKNARRVQHFPR